MKKQNFALSVVFVSLIALFSCSSTVDTAEEKNEAKKPKHVILMIADGIGFNGWLAADYYQGLAGKQSYQIVRPDGTKSHVFGLEHGALNLIDKNGNVLPRNTDVNMASGAVPQFYDPQSRWNNFENAMINDFSNSGSYTTYTDSAAAGTALLSGRKTTVGRINIDWTGKNSFSTIAEIAMEQGLAAGSVTSVMASHATPAAVISHNSSRNNYAEIFNEMMKSGLDVIMGAGHPLYDSSGNKLAEDIDYKYVGGKDTFDALSSNNHPSGFSFIEEKSEFVALAYGKEVPERLIGIVKSGSTLQASRSELAFADTPSGMSFNKDLPDLATMSLGALNVLKQKENGFFLMIEGGAVDWMGHANNMPRYIEEQVDFNQAVDAVIQWVEENSSWEETLLIVTSDHECGGIWGEGTWTNSAGGSVAADRTPEALEAARFNPEEDVFNAFLAVQDKGLGNIPGFQFSSRNHTNDLVPLWALGRGSEKFVQFTRTDLKAKELWGAQYNWDGNYVDNTSVFHVMQSVLSN